MANSALTEDRREFYDTFGRQLISRLKRGGMPELRKAALELQSGGIYSDLTPTCQVELSVLKRLHSCYGEGDSWKKFVSNTVGREWFDGLRVLKRTTITYSNPSRPIAATQSAKK